VHITLSIVTGRRCEMKITAAASSFDGFVRDDDLRRTFSRQ